MKAAALKGAKVCLCAGAALAWCLLEFYQSRNSGIHSHTSYLLDLLTGLQLALAMALLFWFYQSLIGHRSSSQSSAFEFTQSTELTGPNADIFKSFVENIPGVIFRCRLDERRTVLYVNRSVAKVTGYTTSHFLGPGSSSLWDLIHPDDKSRTVEFLTNAASQGFPYVCQYRIITRNQEVRTVEERGKSKRALNGSRKSKILGGDECWLDGVLTDVSDRVAMENELRTNERALHSVLENCRAAVFLKDTSGKHLLVNSAYEEALGLQAGQATGKTDFDLMPYQLALTSSELDQLVVQSLKGLCYEQDVAGFGRSNRVYSITKVPLFDDEGKLYALGGFANDISERKREERLLQEHQRRLTLALDAASAGTFIWHCKNGLIDWDERSREILGFDRYQTRTSFFEWMSRVEPLDAREVCSSLELSRSNQTKWQKEYRLEHAGGVMKTISSAGYFTTDSEGVCDSLTGIVLDISEQKHIQEATRVARQAAEEASRAKSNFLAIMSHEIRTPMNAVIGMTHLVQRTNLSPKQHDYISKIEMSAKSLLGIVNDILDFSKIEAGKFDLDIQEFSLEAVFESLGHVLSVRRGNKESVEIIFRISSEIPSLVTGDPLRLTQILINLGANALKFTEKGEVVVTADVVARRETAVTLKLCVLDSGIGMTDQEVQALFLPFNQGISSRGGKYGGTGLGLSISKMLVDLMQGKIEVHSRPGFGSQFSVTVEFPVSLNSNQLVSPEGQQISGLSILVIDENATSLQVLDTLLRELGHTVRLSCSCPDASKRQFDLVVVDWGLLCRSPNTAKLLATLRSRSPQVKVLVCAYLREDVASLVQSMGLSGVISKPVTRSALKESISSAFDLLPHLQLPSNELRLSKFGPCPILLVEDNEINRQLARELLELSGLIVTTAANGQEAVELASRNIYELILMDVRMPVMDGMEATRVIRAEGLAPKTPIIAMTANVLWGDQAQCLAVGMDDYLTKPIDPEKLVTVIGRYLSPTGFSSIEPENSSEFPSINGVDHRAGIRRVGNNLELYRSLLTQFRDQHLTAALDIRSAVRQADFDSATRIAHNLKGVAANLGAHLVAGHAADIIKLLHKQQISAIDGPIELLEISLARLVRDLAVLEQNDEEACSELEDRNFDSSLAISKLSNIRPLLESDLHSALQHIGELVNYSSNTRYQRQLKKVKDAAQRFDIDLVARLLDEVEERIRTDRAPENPDR